ncbi:MAG: ABC transporter ATP-binding protein [Bacteroidales bacterium]
MKTHFWLLHYLRPYKKAFFLSGLANFLSALFGVLSISMVVPFLGILFLGNGKIFNHPGSFSFSFEYVANWLKYQFSLFTQEHSPLRAILFLTLAVVVATLFRSLFAYFSRRWQIRYRIHITKKLRNKMLDGILQRDYVDFKQQRRGDLVSRFSSDLNQFEFSVLSSVETFFRAPVMLLVYLFALFTLHFYFSLLVLVLMVMGAILLVWSGRRLKQASLSGQRRIGSLLSSLTETLEGIKIVKAFGIERQRKQQFRHDNDQYSATLQHVLLRRALAGPVTDGISVLGMALIIGLGSYLVVDEQLSAEAFIAYLALLTQVVGPLKSLVNAYYGLQRGSALHERLQEMMNPGAHIVNVPHAPIVKNLQQGIRFRKVSFRYQNQEVLTDISLQIPRGATVAFVGPSGGGKSTLVDLIPRYLEASSGKILWDDTDIRQLDVVTLRRQVGYVNQEPILFHDTIYNNLLCGAGCNEDAVIQAAKMAYAHDFIQALPHGYQTWLSDRGESLSLGERQRLSIARALIKNPPVLILDEPTSSLDSAAEKLVNKALKVLMENRTTIVIAHKLSTITHADIIYVMDKGTILESGTHNSLMDQKGVYFELTTN